MLSGRGAPGEATADTLTGDAPATGGVAAVGVAAAGVAAGTPLHLLLRLSDGEAVARHRDVAERAGAVWWPRYGAARTRPTSRQARLRDQLSAGIETWVYLLDGRAAHRARLVAIAFDPAALDRDRLVAGFDPARSVSGLYLLGSFRETTRRSVVDDLVLDSAPRPGGLRKSLRGSQATLYVRHLEAGPKVGGGRPA